MTVNLETFLNDETSRQVQFPVTSRRVFMAHAGVSPLPKAAVDVMGAFLEQAGGDHQESGFVPVNERFLSGGEGSVRGYPRNSLGPTDDEGNPVGGKAVIEVRGEARLRRVGKWQLVLFADTGMVWHDVSAIDLSQLAVGAGAGIRYGTPIGSLRFDAAYPVSNGGDWQFYFGIGQAF